MSKFNYEPDHKPIAVCKAGEFNFSVVSPEHGHAMVMAKGLIEAGATLKYIWGENPETIKKFLLEFPMAETAPSLDVVLDDMETRLIVSTAIPNERSQLGMKVMGCGKDYFTDKTPFTTMEQVSAARDKAKETGRKYMNFYSEHMYSESAVYAGQLIDRGAIGRVVQVLGLGPHRLNAWMRPDWFFKKVQYGGILCDMAPHHIEQLLVYSGAKDAVITSSRVANYKNPQYPELEDYGEATLVADNGAVCYLRVDWLSPEGLSVWGDGRTFILGTEGYIEVRKYVDITTSHGMDNVLIVNLDGEQRFNVAGKVGLPFFSQFILDCINRTEYAMSQELAFNVGELGVKVQNMANGVET